MLKKTNVLGLFLGALLVAAPAFGQAGPTATALSNVQVGGGFSYARTDYGQKGDKGLTFFGDYDIGLHWGGEAEYHYTSISTPDNVSQNSFLAGPRIILRKNRFKLYGKGMIGIGRISINNPFTHLSETDFLYAGGGGLEYLVGRHITIRAIDAEYQRWSFQSGLTPFVATAGVAYRFH